MTWTKLRNIYFNHNGKIGRWDFFIYTLPLAVLKILAFVLAWSVSTYFLAMLLLIIYPGLVLVIKRFRDFGAPISYVFMYYAFAIILMLGLYQSPSMFLTGFLSIYRLVFLYFVYFKKGIGTR
ncbi:MAG: hypothetical protein LBR35_02555 [Rickettsiales bacterium]|nr:hypothetical protein [Rickettsiales bacterium]